MSRVEDFVPWKVTDISLRPYKGMWSMNPSIHYDGVLWRCILRCADYCMRDGKTIRSDRATPGESRTRNAMAIFDPISWKPIEIYKMRERDGLPRASCSSVGYEDIRLFRTDRGGLQGIAASLHLQRDERSRKQLAEQVVLSFDENYDVVDARPIRGASWDGVQKNWVPFDNCAESRFLQAIEEGALFDDRGSLRGSEAVVRLSAGLRAATTRGPDDRKRARAKERALEADQVRAREQRKQEAISHRARHFDLATVGSSQLRGGTQLVRVGDGAWLGIGHAMKFVDAKKLYWHVWYLVDGQGKMKSVSPPMKLAPNKIEFAAGMAIDGDRVVVSFGVDDMESKIAETRLSAVMGMLQKIAFV